MLRDEVGRVARPRRQHDVAERLDQAIRAAHRAGGAVALLLIDIDRFKEVNDTLGHACGDMLLVEVARRIGAGIGEWDTLARSGGDSECETGEPTSPNTCIRVHHGPAR